MNLIIDSNLNPYLISKPLIDHINIGYFGSQGINDITSPANYELHRNCRTLNFKLCFQSERVNEEKWSECIKVSWKRNILKVLCKVVTLKAELCTVNGRLHLVRVDGDTKEAGVGVDQLVDIADLQIPENGGVIEVGQVGHVLTAVELWGVHLAHLVLLVNLLLAPEK